MKETLTSTLSDGCKLSGNHKPPPPRPRSRPPSIVPVVNIDRHVSEENEQHCDEPETSDTLKDVDTSSCNDGSTETDTQQPLTNNTTVNNIESEAPPADPLLTSCCGAELSPSSSMKQRRSSYSMTRYEDVSLVTSVRNMPSDGVRTFTLDGLGINVGAGTNDEDESDGLYNEPYDHTPRYKQEREVERTKKRKFIVPNVDLTIVFLI